MVAADGDFASHRVYRFLEFEMLTLLQSILHCLVQVALLRKFCFIEHGPIQSYELVNERIGISGVHETSTTIVLEDLKKCSGMRGWR